MEILFVNQIFGRSFQKRYSRYQVLAHSSSRAISAAHLFISLHHVQSISITSSTSFNHNLTFCNSFIMATISQVRPMLDIILKDPNTPIHVRITIDPEREEHTGSGRCTSCAQDGIQCLTSSTISSHCAFSIQEEWACSLAVPITSLGPPASHTRFYAQRRPVIQQRSQSRVSQFTAHPRPQQRPP